MPDLCSVPMFRTRFPLDGATHKTAAVRYVARCMTMTINCPRLAGLLYAFCTFTPQCLSCLPEGATVLLENAQVEFGKLLAPLAAAGTHKE